MILLYGAFFLSGIPALIYQILWQRSLFTIFGVDIVSVTVVVSAFLLGLGIGGVVGGALSRQSRIHALALFGAMELGIGAFALISLRLIETIGSFMAGAGMIASFAASFALVVLPTIFMGATLPILVTDLVRRNAHIGRSVGGLYFANTLGSAFACVLAVALMSKGWGKADVVLFGAVLNFAVGGVALALYTFATRQPWMSEKKSMPLARSGMDSAGKRLGWPVALIAVGIAGYVSLSYEIVWVRVYSLASHGIAHTFPVLLAAFLLGIALGSFVSRDLCRLVVERPDRTVPMIAGLLLAGSIVGYVVGPGVARAASAGGHWIVTLPLVTVSAGLFGAILPLVSHAGIDPSNRPGVGVSQLYIANIVGSVAGSLVTGLLLMDVLSLRSLSVALALLGITVAVALILDGRVDVKRIAPYIGVAAAFAFVVVTLEPSLFDRFFERLQFGAAFAGRDFAHVVEGRSGVVTVTRDGVVYGSGVYDGSYNTDLVNDRNGIHRAFFALGLHPSPKNVLMIGLSSGSWAQVIASDPTVEKFTIVEINPGYLDLLPVYPDVASLLNNPKVKIVIDDGRRWLASHPERRFDVIVSNTTFHWRAGITNLLSVEFLSMVRAHLNPGGIFTYNTTGSNDVQKTGATVFPYAVRDDNFLVVSDARLEVDAAEWGKWLKGYVTDGRPVFDMNIPRHRARFEELEAWAGRYGPPSAPILLSGIEVRDSILARTAKARLVTDENMGVEWTLGDAERDAYDAVGAGTAGNRKQGL